MRASTHAELWAGEKCVQFDPVLVHRAKMEEKDFVDKMGLYDVIPRTDAGKTGCRVIRIQWVLANWGSDDRPQLRARWVAQVFRGQGGDRYEYFSDTPDVALINAAVANVALQVCQSDTVAAVFDVRRAYFYDEVKRNTFVELQDNGPADQRASCVGMQGTARYSTGSCVMGR